MAKWKRVYRVEAAIYSGINDELVWEGAFQVDARNKTEARQKARSALEQLVYFDDRIDPRGSVSPAELLYEEAE